MTTCVIVHCDLLLLSPTLLVVLEFCNTTSTRAQPLQPKSASSNTLEFTPIPDYTNAYERNNPILRVHQAKVQVAGSAVGPR